MTQRKPFDLDQYLAKHRNPPYVFTFAGRDWELKNAKDLDAWASLAAADGGDVHAMVEAMRLGFGDEQFEEFRQIPLPADGLRELFERWQKHSGFEPGE